MCLFARTPQIVPCLGPLNAKSMGCGSSTPLDPAAAQRPILAPGDPILFGFAQALEDEYVRHMDCAVGAWWDPLPKPNGMVGTVTEDAFEGWLDNVEGCVEKGLLQVAALRQTWGLMQQQPMAPPGMQQQPMMMAQPMMQAQTAMQTVSVQVPQGMQGGMPMQVQTPGGVMQVQIPPGLQPGMTFQIQVPAQPMMAQPMMAQPMEQPAVIMGTVLS